MSALQQHKLFVFYLKWEGATDRLLMIRSVDCSRIIHDHDFQLGTFSKVILILTQNDT